MFGTYKGAAKQRQHPSPDSRGPVQDQQKPKQAKLFSEPQQLSEEGRQALYQELAKLQPQSGTSPDLNSHNSDRQNCEEGQHMLSQLARSQEQLGQLIK